jgi:hypothetical protein
MKVAERASSHAARSRVLEGRRLAIDRDHIQWRLTMNTRYFIPAFSTERVAMPLLRVVTATGAARSCPRSGQDFDLLTSIAERFNCARSQKQEGGGRSSIPQRTSRHHHEEN